MSTVANRMGVLAEIAEERDRQIERHGRTPEHDDRHTTQEWAYLLLRRVTDLSHPWPEAHLDVRRELVEIAAISVAAIEALDRSADARAEEPAGPDGRREVDHQGGGEVQ